MPPGRIWTVPSGWNRGSAADRAHVAVGRPCTPAVLGLKWLISGPEPILLLFCSHRVVAIAFGLRAGLLAGVGGIALTAIATAVDGSNHPHGDGWRV
jgi:hypothetical protein